MNYIAWLVKMQFKHMQLTDSMNSGLMNGSTECSKMQWPKITNNIVRNLIE